MKLESDEYSDKDVDIEIDSRAIKPYQHEPIEEDLEELVASEEDSMSDDEGSAYKGKLNNLNW